MWNISESIGEITVSLFRYFPFEFLRKRRAEEFQESRTKKLMHYDSRLFNAI